jgi:hypothetical protein
MTIQTSCLQSLLCICLPCAICAQSPPADSSQSLPESRATLYYQAFVGQDAALYNGVAYQQNYRGVEGDPYFETANLKSATVTYEDIAYAHIPILYDLIHDQVAIADKTGQLLIPAANKLNRFSFNNHLFVRLTVNDNPGYYELLRSGYVTLLVRHTKTITEKIESNELRRIVAVRDHYFIYKQGSYLPVESGQQLLTLLDDKKTDLRQFQRSHHIRFKKDPETAMESIIDYYNQLPH